MRVGYLPDMFGHCAQMPQILRAAGPRRLRRLARRPVSGRQAPVPVGRNRRLNRARRVPPGRVRQRGALLPGAGRAGARAVRGALQAVVRRRRHPRHGRDGSHAAAAGADLAHSRRRTARDARRVPRRRSADERLARVQGRAALRGTREPPPRRHLLAHRPEGCVRASGALARALRRAAAGALRRRVAGAVPAAGVVAHVPELRARLDLRLLRRRGLRPGPRALRRGGADRQGARVPRRRPNRRAGS